MPNKRLSDLPEVTSSTVGDVVAIDGTTTRKITVENLLDDNLVAIKGLASAANKGIQFTGAGTAATYDLTSAGKALLDDADPAAQRTTLGLGSAAVANTSAFATAAQGSTADSAVQPGDPEAVPSGGTTGQVLAKASNTDGDTEWVDQTGGGREKLSASRTYYVRTDGSNSNTGLVNSAGGAFLTLQKALNVISSTLDVGGQAVTISVGTGAFSAGIDFSAGWVGGGSIIVSGAPSTISVASANCFQNTGVLGGIVTIQNLTLICTGGGGSAISNSGVGTINIGSGVTFGDMAGGDHIFAQGSSAYITSSSSYTISGGGRTHCLARSAGVVDLYNGGTGLVTTVSASVSFSSAFASSSTLGFIQSINRTYSIGAFTVTGTRYLVALNAVINTNGAGANLFPGTVAGSTATGGQYA